jgi:hypothetical protein
MFYLDSLNAKFLRYLNYISYNHRKRAAICLTNNKINLNNWFIGACQFRFTESENKLLTFFIGSYTFYTSAESINNTFVWTCEMAYHHQSTLSNEKTALSNTCYITRDLTGDRDAVDYMFQSFAKSYYYSRICNGEKELSPFCFVMRGRWPHYKFYFIFNHLKRGDLIENSDHSDHKVLFSWLDY